MADVENVPEINLVREKEPNSVRNLKIWVIIVGSISQFLILIYSPYKIFMSFRADEAECNDSTTEPCTNPWPFTTLSHFAVLCDVLVFTCCPLYYLVGLFFTISKHRNPGKHRKPASFHRAMYPALFPTVYCYLYTVYLLFSAVDRASKFYLVPYVWINVAWTSLVVIIAGYVMVVVCVSIDLCQHLHDETVNYVRMVRVLQELL
ncbi:hypothetical protein QR680_014879 [Steinernema hermaphroditum]|uniref:Uncharacterized protein n=1 Tax=Steinernema hermaphroditum TaxID=289476 RepID=A0AA39ID18_9BILA|nr:hypothetical protein QR680_014879 [Steinernema hermaphroditum]